MKILVTGNFKAILEVQDDWNEIAERSASEADEIILTVMPNQMDMVDFTVDDAYEYDA